MTNNDPRTSCGKPCDCPSYRAHLMSISVSSTATPSRDRSRETVEAIAREKSWDKDIPAYKRLRAEGLQPKHIDGSASFEVGARDRIEIEDGKNYGRDLNAVKEAKQIAKELQAQ